MVVFIDLSKSAEIYRQHVIYGWMYFDSSLEVWDMLFKQQTDFLQQVAF